MNDIDITAPPRKAPDQGMRAIHENDRERETLRFRGQWSKMLFHPRPNSPTEPNAGFVRYDPGAHHPLHRHDFAQIWYMATASSRSARGNTALAR